ncbi:ABC transporter ATP-binding protein [Methanosarcina sp. A14]|uniref:ATPase component of general energizing module of ECF transporters n=1 Tax=Methanosarcina barkeri MS TaxID=1434108 RepID=A0A0E3LMU9_METBA|nr:MULTISPECIES: energy-coupling factor transporter ATPase [Methanosarcina]AKB53651.1 ATPase component of general energizing module of ECF transporters [Methanosarcina barkeri MS]OED06681.1 ABC transporter ATP-binding protein [Methanosarcina sp. A14]
MIEIKDLWYTYPGRSEPTLKGINLRVEKGEFVLLTGPTGCGKSTLLKTLNGIIPHESGGILSGSVKVKGMETTDSNQMEISKEVGLVFQNPDDQIFSTIVEDEVAFGPENLCFEQKEIDKKVTEALQIVGMSDHRLDSTNSLSGGQKQRICIASMLAMEPEILAMDEPVSQMDPMGTHEVLNTVRELNRKLKTTILLVEHRLHELAPFVDRVVIMDNGKIVFDQPASKAFDNLEIFYRLGLRIPEPVKLCHSLGIKASPLSVSGALAVLDREIKENNRIPQQLIQNPDKNPVTKTSSKKTSSKKASVENNAHGNNDSENNAHGNNAHGNNAHGNNAHGNNAHRDNGSENNDSIISIQALWSGYEKNKMVLKGINLEIRKGERVAIMGTNGSGKSTLLLHLAAILKPDKGSVRVFGEDTRPKNPYSFAGKVGFVFQNPDLMLFCDSAEEEVRFGPVQLKYSNVEERVRNSLEAMSILPLRHDLPQALSRGQRLRTAVASVLSINPELILLDEPTTGQDKVNIEQMMDFFKNNNSTLIFCTHDIEVAMSYATRILVMNEGQIIADGKGKEVIKDTETLKKASLTQPPVVEIANHLGINAFSVKELVETLTSRNVEEINSGSVEEINSGSVEEINSGSVEGINSRSVEKINSGSVEEINSRSVEGIKC